MKNLTFWLDIIKGISTESLDKKIIHLLCRFELLYKLYINRIYKVSQ